MDSKLIFGYWNTQGLAQPLRYLLEYLQIPYTEKNYCLSNFQEWKTDKNNLGFDFPNLSYIIDGDFKLTESLAILRWIPHKAKNLKLLGENEYDEVKITMIIGVCYDLFEGIVDVCQLPADTVQARKVIFLEKFGLKLKNLSKFLGEKEWLLGYITIADFVACYILDLICGFDVNLIAKEKNLIELRRRFMELDIIAKYKLSERYIKRVFPSDFFAWYELTD